MLPSNDDNEVKVLKITTPQSFQISDPEALKKDSVRSTSLYRDVIRKMMPQLEDKPLKCRHCP
jgi:hypothetical protein